MRESHPTELLPAFALGCLDPDEKVLVKEHVRTCASCQAELRELEMVNSSLAYAAPAAVPPESLKKRLLATCRPQRGYYSWFNALFERWPKLVPATALAACLLTVLFATSSLLLWQGAKQPLSSIADMRIIPLQGTDNMPSAVGRLVTDAATGQGWLLVDALQPLKESLQYQLWLIRDGQRTSGGVFSVSQEGTANVRIASARPFSAYDSVGITIEPFGGSPSPTGKKVLGGRMAL
jgi:anti-sigma-K factor RskA